MSFIDGRRKVIVKSDEKTWVFKAVDGSVIEKPEDADEKLTAALSDFAKAQELISGTSQDKITYTTSHKTVATVTGSGIITAKKKGTARITVKAGKKSYVVTVTVK